MLSKKTPRLGREERRRQLLSVAERMFGERGFGSTEVEGLARECGISKPILYRHFPKGKAQILGELLDGYERQLVMALWAAISGSNDPRRRLYDGLDAYFRFVSDHPAAFRLLEEAAADPDPSVKEHVPEVRRTIAQGVANTIADVMQAAGLEPRWSPIYAHAVIGAAQAVARWWLEHRDAPREEVVDHLLAFVWRGFDSLPRDPTEFRRSGAG